MNKAEGMMQPWRVVRANSLQGLSCKHPTACHQGMHPLNSMLCPLLCGGAKLQRRHAEADPCARVRSGVGAGQELADD
jgi:hypothetical protein